MTLDVDLVVVGGGMTSTGRSVPVAARRRAGQERDRLADARRHRPRPPGPPGARSTPRLASLGAVLAARDRDRDVSGEPLVVAGGSVVTPSAVIEHGHVVVDGTGGSSPSAATGGSSPRPTRPSIDATGCWVTPGFIDVQLNGGHGIDLTTEPGRAGELGAVPTPLRRDVVRADDHHVRRRAAGGRADVVGGRDATASAAGAVAARPPPRRADAAAGAARGASVDLLRDPAPALIDGWSRAVGVLLATLAPELPGALEPIAALAERGVVVSIGHTDCTAERVRRRPSPPARRTSPTCSTRCGRSPTATPVRSAPRSPTTRWSPASSATASTSTPSRCGWRGGRSVPIG